MQEIIYGVNTYYEEYGGGDHYVLLLHGWGMDSSSMAWISEELNGFHVYVFDLPGFGKSELLKSFDIYNYCDWLHEFCLKYGISDPIVIAHSFGCRIALWYSYIYGTGKLVLTGAAGIQSRKNRIQKLQEMEYHIIKNIYRLLGMKQQLKQLQNSRGSLDYRLANSIMKDTLVKVLHNDVSNILSEIEVSTIVIIGELDDQTPVWMGKLFEEKMQDCALIVFEKCNHFAYLQQKSRFMRIVNVFLEEGEEHVYSSTNVEN